MQALVAPSEAIFLDAKFEAELVELGDDDEAREMLAEMGVDEPGLDVLARVGFDTLGLQTYLTAGPKESRAWTVRQGATAPEAAGVIHTDFQKGFIKAEIVSYDDLMSAGSMLKAKELGKVRMEGKDYVMQDGDVVEFRWFASTSDVPRWRSRPRACRSADPCPGGQPAPRRCPAVAHRAPRNGQWTVGPTPGADREIVNFPGFWRFRCVTGLFV